MQQIVPLESHDSQLYVHVLINTFWCLVVLNITVNLVLFIEHGFPSFPLVHITFAFGLIKFEVYIKLPATLFKIF